MGWFERKQFYYQFDFENFEAQCILIDSLKNMRILAFRSAFNKRFDAWCSIGELSWLLINALQLYFLFPYIIYMCVYIFELKVLGT